MSARHSPIRFKARVCVLQTSLKWENTHKAGPHRSFGFSFHVAPLRLGTLIQHGRRASRKHTFRDTLAKSAQAEMTWQNSQLLSRSHAPADPGGQGPKAGVPASRVAGRLLPHRTPVPEAEASAVAAPRGAGPALSEPCLDRLLPPLPERLPAPGTQSAARPRLAAPAALFPLQWARQGCRAAQTKRSAAPGVAGAEAWPRLPLPPTRRTPAAPVRHHPDRGAAARDRPGEERRGGRGAPGPRRGRRLPPCLPAPPRSAVPSGQCAAAARAERAPRPTPPTPAE